MFEIALSRSVFVGAVSFAAIAAAGAGNLQAQQPYRIIANWKIGGDARWDYLHIDSKSQRLYVSHGNKVEVIDAKTGKIVGTIEGLQGSHGIVVDSSGKFGYISDSGGGVVIFDAGTFAEVKTIPTQYSTDGIVYEPLTKTVWTYAGRDGAANAVGIDTAKQEVIATIPVAKGRLEASTADGKGHVFANIGGDIVRIDAKAKQIDATWTTGCPGASGLAFDSKNNRIFQACGGKKMYIVDATNGNVLGTAEIGDRPDSAGYSAKFQLAFASTGDGYLTVVNAGAPGFPVLEKLETENGARTMDYDPVKDRVYTLAADRDPNAPLPAAPRGPPAQQAQGGAAGPAQNAPRPTTPNYLPDSFHVVVIGR